MIVRELVARLDELVTKGYGNLQIYFDDPNSSNIEGKFEVDEVEIICDEDDKDIVLIK